MNKNILIKKVFNKLSKKPMLGSFYILDGNIYYSTINGGLDHPKLWKHIIAHLLPNKSPRDIKELLDANYGTDRGRISWTGEIIDNEPIGDGKYTLNGTPGCEKYEKKIKSIFGIYSIPQEKVKTEWETSEYYFTPKADKEVVNKFIEENKADLKSTHVAKTIDVDKLIK